MLTTLMTIIVIWTLVAIPVSLSVGTFLSLATPKEGEQLFEMLTPQGQRQLIVIPNWYKSETA